MRNVKTHQGGVGLITLLIALALGIFLLAGLFQIWLQTRQTFGVQGQLAQLQDSERMALTTMANTIQTAGFYPVYLNYSATPPTTPYTLANSFVQSGGFGAEQFVTGTHTATPPGDTLSLRFVADSSSTNSNNPTLDCQGQTETTGTLVTNTYEILNGMLQCSTDGGNTWQPIITNPVSDMQVYYVIDQLGDGNQLQYMTADQVTNGSYWGKVISIEVELWFNNPLYGLPGQNGQPAILNPIYRIASVNQTEQ
ncbi:PilW family protein [Dyella sp. C9]|uniref:PilW family protein n=1 Tax=Dyella sp. C9 TaxID=2202154 RepID=UPI00130095EC|nr:PilW family protein [Dyella sp. C9]